MCEYFELIEQWNHLNYATGQAILEILGFKITY